MNTEIKYKTSQVAEIFLKKPFTVNRWAKEFAEFLEKDANPGKNQLKLFSTLDVRKLALVKEQRDNGRPDDETRARLLNGELGEIPDSVTALSYLGGKNIPVHLQQHVALLESSLAQAKQELEQARGDNRELQGIIKNLREELAEAKKTIRETYIEIGQLKK